MAEVTVYEDAFDERWRNSKWGRRHEVEERIRDDVEGVLSDIDSVSVISVNNLHSTSITFRSTFAEDTGMNGIPKPVHRRLRDEFGLVSAAVSERSIGDEGAAKVRVWFDYVPALEE